MRCHGRSCVIVDLDDHDYCNLKLCVHGLSHHSGQDFSAIYDKVLLQVYHTRISIILGAYGTLYNDCIPAIIDYVCGSEMLSLLLVARLGDVFVNYNCDPAACRQRNPVEERLSEKIKVSAR